MIPCTVCEINAEKAETFTLTLTDGGGNVIDRGVYCEKCWAALRDILRSEFELSDGN